MKLLMICLLVLEASIACSQANSKNKPTKGNVGAPCEGCEAIYESPVSFDQLSHKIELPDWKEQGPKLVVSGVIYKADGKTPAPNVIVYVYHTNQTGYYPSKGNEQGWGKRHGYIRGWMRTNEKGEYQFSTLKPAPYPNASDPAHIHITIKEPELNEYYIDEFVFDDDPLLTSLQRSRLENRGGSGILKLALENNQWVATRAIRLGENIPAYPLKK